MYKYGQSEEIDWLIHAHFQYNDIFKATRLFSFKGDSSRIKKRYWNVSIPSMIKTWKLTYFGAKIYWIAKKIVLKIKKDRSMFSSRFYIPDVIVRLRISHDQTNRTNKVLKINAISLEILLDPTYRYFCWFYIEYILYWPVWSIYQ